MAIPLVDSAQQTRPAPGSRFVRLSWMSEGTVESRALTRACYTPSRFPKPSYQPRIGKTRSDRAQRGASRQMEIRGQHRFSAPRQRVWELLLDPKILQQCLPGAEELVEVGPEEYEARMKIGEKDEPNSYHMAVEGKGPAGQISGDAKIDLAEDGEGTLVNWVGNANVRGTLARVGGRVMQPAAKMIVGQFFTCLEEKVG